MKELPTEDELISSYKPALLDIGGEHLVFKFPEHPNVVGKVSWVKIKEGIYTVPMQTADSERLMREHAESKFRHDIVKKNEEVQALRKHFGKQHTLPERRYLCQVPITPELLAELFVNDFRQRELPKHISHQKEVWTHISIQRYAGETQDPERLEFAFGHYPENDNIDMKEYEDLLPALYGMDEGKGFSESRFLALQDQSPNKALSTLLAKAHDNEGLKNAVSDFVRKSIEYAISNGQILALAGRDNVIFNESNEGWTYLLLDAIPVPTDPILIRAEELVQSSEILTESEREELVRAANFVRTVNGVALSLGVRERLHIPGLYETLMSNPSKI